MSSFIKWACVYTDRASGVPELIGPYDTQEEAAIIMSAVLSEEGTPEDDEDEFKPYDPLHAFIVSFAPEWVSG